jgi:N-acetylglutamate synthase-like GNAT family acetyltransferase
MIVRRESSHDAETLRRLFSEVDSETMFDACTSTSMDAGYVLRISRRRSWSHRSCGCHAGKVESAAVLALEAPSVDPDHRGEGVGHALMYTVLGAAEARGDPLVGLVATPLEWFEQFGFVAGEGHSIQPSVGGWKPYFGVRPLAGYDRPLLGTFVFPAAFGA